MSHPLAQDIVLSRAGARSNPPRSTAHPITVRDQRFGRSGQNARNWIGGDPIASAWHNALSATFPRGEAFFIESVKAHRDGAPSPLADEIRAFVQQEVNHTREHVAFNKAIIAAGYDLSGIDAHVTKMLDLAKERPPIVNLAATMALEHYTAMLAHLLLADPKLLEGADGGQANLWRWHAVEEIEHKGVAYDTWLHATAHWPRFRRWWVRGATMLQVTKNFVPHRISDTLDLLAQDGHRGWRTRMKVLNYLFGRPGVLRRILPAWLGYFVPGFHPWNHDDSALMHRAEADLKSA